MGVPSCDAIGMRKVAALIGSFLGIALTSWAFWLEPRSLRNEDHVIHLPKWQSECDGVRIAVLADLHTGSPYNGIDKLEEIIDLTLAARPDLVLLAGDYVIHGVVGGTFTPPEEIAARLSRLEGSMGVYAVLGNHDRWLDGPRVERALESAGIPVLENESTSVQHGACRFWLAGISDFRTSTPDVDAALAAVPEAAPVIVFTHNPDIFPEIPPRVSLTIAGHTHGGQVYIPGIGRPIVPSIYRQRYAAGHVVERGRHLFVSTGLGTSILPVRFLVPPEVSVLRIHRATLAAASPAP